VLVFDGDCGFCTRSARWGERRLPPGTAVVAWQALPDLSTYGLTERDVRTAAYWIDADGRPHRGHRGVAHTLIAIGGAWSVLGRVMLIPPFSWLAAGVYRLVARYRYRLPGATDACRVPADTKGAS
jgi:predicted DCC family thiol-disulfide oxidoreductase YuxK